MFHWDKDGGGRKPRRKSRQKDIEISMSDDDGRLGNSYVRGVWGKIEWEMVKLRMFWPVANEPLSAMSGVRESGRW